VAGGTGVNGIETGLVEGVVGENRFLTAVAAG